MKALSNFVIVKYNQSYTAMSMRQQRAGVHFCVIRNLAVYGLLPIFLVRHEGSPVSALKDLEDADLMF